MSYHVLLRGIVVKDIDASKELPRREDAFALIHTFIREVHPDYPALEPEALYSVLEALYASPSIAEEMDGDPFHNGWPASMKDFRWNSQLNSPELANTTVPMPVVAFIIFMVLNVAAIVKIRMRIYEHSPERLYRTAMLFAGDCFSQISLSTIQGLVTLIMHAVMTPADVNIWTLVHIAMAQCIEIGIHREPQQVLPAEQELQQLKRFVFYTIYSLDR